MIITKEQQALLDGQAGPAKQMGMRLLLDLATSAGAEQLIPIQSAHLSGVSPLTGGLGLRLFLKKLTTDPRAKVAVPTSLNSAGCDESQFEAMRIVVPNYLADHQEIIKLYTQLGVQPTQSCIPYEWDELILEGNASWAESNAICFGNSYLNLQTNRESGLSALASALTGYTADYGLLQPQNRYPNLKVEVSADLSDPTDFSVLGDWIGKQLRSKNRFPLGPIPYIVGLPAQLTHEQKKALTAAAANYGSPLLYLETDPPPVLDHIQYTLSFTQKDLADRYAQLAPQTAVSLVALGCPQASIGELKAVASLLHGKQLNHTPDLPPLWLFTSSANFAIAERLGIAQIITNAGALLLINSCPEVVPYDPSWVKHILTNSMKAEHYIQSGLNGIPTSVLPLKDCIAIALGEKQLPHNPTPIKITTPSKKQPIAISSTTPALQKTFTGSGLPSQSDFSIRGTAFVTDTPITFLGFVNRATGIIEEEGHPANGKSLAGKIAIFPKGSGSTVAPYVLLELFYQGMAPIGIINTDIDQQTAPACSLENIPYAYAVDPEILYAIPDGAEIEFSRVGQKVTIKMVDLIE